MLCLILGSTGLQLGLGIGYYLAGFQILACVWLVVIWFCGWTTVIFARWYMDEWHSDHHEGDR